MEKHQGSNIRRFRQFIGIKQQALSLALGKGWNQQRVSALENRKNIDVSTLNKVATALGIPIEALRSFDVELMFKVLKNMYSDKSQKAMIGRYQREPAFRKKYGLTSGDMAALWKLFLEYGLTKGKAKHRSSANHYFLQGICEHTVLEWSTWERGITKELRVILETEYPLLMIDDKSFSEN